MTDRIKIIDSIYSLIITKENPVDFAFALDLKGVAEEYNITTNLANMLIGWAVVRVRKNA